MNRNVHIGIAKMAILVLVTVMNTITYANESALSLPQNSSEPVALGFPESTVDWEQVKASDILQVFVGTVDQCCDNRLPVAGRYAFKNNILIFTPAFNFITGQDYVVRTRVSGTEEKLIKFSIPTETSIAVAQVTAVYPSGDTLPENTLRFYLHFAVPMSPHSAFDYIKWRDSAGNVDEAVFMRFKQELWNADRTRLTVLVDPGRIKRDVSTNLELGPASLAGQQYTLTVDEGWPSATGSSVLPAFSKRFRVGKALRERPDVNAWQVTSPCFGTREPVHIEFDRPFDRHLLDKDIRITSDDGRPVAGMIQVGQGETSWSFTPDEPWMHDHLNIIVNPKLEDVAGNNFHDLLDQTISQQSSNTVVTTLRVRLKNCSG